MGLALDLILEGNESGDDEFLFLEFGENWISLPSLSLSSPLSMSCTKFPVRAVVLRSRVDRLGGLDDERFDIVVPREERTFELKLGSVNSKLRHSTLFGSRCPTKYWKATHLFYTTSIN